MRELTSEQARREFSAILDGVLRGERVTVTRFGRPVAIIAPADPEHGGPTTMRLIADALDPLDREARKNVLRWAANQYGPTPDEVAKELGESE